MWGCVRGSRFLAAALLVSSLAACQPRVLRVIDPQDPLLRGLVGWWRFDDGAGSTTAHDSSDEGNDGTLTDVDGTNPLTWPPRPDYGGTSIELGGAGYVEVPLSPSIDGIVDQVSVAAWVYFEGDIPVDYATAISREIGTTNGQYYHLSIFSDDTPVMFVTTQGGQTRLNTALPVSRFRWTHLAGTYDGTSAVLYVDGVSVQNSDLTGAFAKDTTPLILGGNGNGPSVGVSERFPGQLDEIMLYNRALTPSEIVRLASPTGPGLAAPGR
jgi:hypothetical protein